MTTEPWRERRSVPQAPAVQLHDVDSRAGTWVDADGYPTKSHRIWRADTGATLVDCKIVVDGQEPKSRRTSALSAADNGGWGMPYLDELLAILESSCPFIGTFESAEHPRRTAEDLGSWFVTATMSDQLRYAGAFQAHAGDVACGLILVRRVQDVALNHIQMGVLRLLLDSRARAMSIDSLRNRVAGYAQMPKPQRTGLVIALLDLGYIDGDAAPGRIWITDRGAAAYERLSKLRWLYV